MDLLSAISGALDRAIRPPDRGRPDYLLAGDAEAAERDLAETPKPGAFEKVDQRMDRLTRELAEAAVERERLLVLGRQHRQLQAQVVAMEARLQEAGESIAAIETAAATAWGHAQTYLGDRYHRGVSASHTMKALDFDAQAAAMRERLMPRLRDEAEAARREVRDFGKKHDITAIESAESAAA